MTLSKNCEIFFFTSQCPFLCILYLSCPIPMRFFRGLSLVLSSHDQFEASHWPTLLSLPPPHPGSSTRWNSEQSRQPTRKSPKNEELFRIAYMDRPRVGTRKSLVDRLGRALKTRSCSGLHTWIVHAWEVFDGWTSALVDQLEEP